MLSPFPYVSELYVCTSIDERIYGCSQMGNASETHNKVAEGHSDGGLVAHHESMDVDNSLIKRKC